jgi:SpoVK/Ycf46/Vps4 family AAA+-type ATPase
MPLECNTFLIVLYKARNDREGESSRRVKTEFLIQMEGITPASDPTKQVLVLGATVSFDFAIST